MSEQRNEAEYAYFILLVAEGRECEHPDAFRHALDLAPDLDGWRCGICLTDQVEWPPKVQP